MLSVEGLHLRAAFFRLVRTFFHRQGFLEVDTPIRQPVYIPESNITPIGADGQFLQTSPELCMKRLLAAGCSRIFQICPCFRGGERGRLHREEFQMLEWYRRGADYHRLMEDCEQLVRFLAEQLPPLVREFGLSGQDLFAGVELAGRWPRLTLAEAFDRFSPLELERALAEDCFEEMLVEHIEPHLGRGKPVFLYDYPVQLGSLARTRSDTPALAERFELYLDGIELANGFSELTDSSEQRRRFAWEIGRIEASTGHRPAMPDKFLAALDRLDTAAGIALGFDRLVMLALNKRDLAQVVSFSPEDF